MSSDSDARADAILAPLTLAAGDVAGLGRALAAAGLLPYRGGGIRTPWGIRARHGTSSEGEGR